MKLKLVYRDAALGDAWREQFADQKDVEVIGADICHVPCDAVVSPANSFGFMDGGLDYLLSERFGWQLESRVKATIAARPMRELLVGESIIVPTDDALVPWLVVAPTMRVPMHVKTSVNAYLAMKALLTTTLAFVHERAIDVLAIPGLATGVGAVPPETAAAQMFAAFREVIRGDVRSPVDFGEAQRQHLALNRAGMIYD